MRFFVLAFMYGNRLFRFKAGINEKCVEWIKK